MDMRIDPAGNHILAARVDDAGRLEVDRLRRREGDDAAVLDAHVERLAGVGGTTVPPRIKTSSMGASAWFR